MERVRFDTMMEEMEAETIQKNAASLKSQRVGETFIIDSMWHDNFGNLAHRRDGDAIFDKYGNRQYEIRGGSVYDTYGNKKFDVRGNSIYDTEGNRKFEVRGDSIYDTYGNRLGSDY